MKIVSWNVNGIRSAHGKGFLDFVKEHDPDVLCLQEIKANKEQLPSELVDLEGYKLYINSAEKKGYSGVAVYSKLRPLSVEYDIGFSRFDSEGRMLVLRYENFVLINFYLPHGGRDKSNLGYKMESYDFLVDYVKEILLEGPPVLLVGDFNIARADIDLARAKENKKNIMFSDKERLKIGEVIGCGFKDCFREMYPNEVKYSWWPYVFDLRKRNVGWRIDYVFACDKMFSSVKDSFILNEVEGSDHCPVGVELDG